QSPPPGDRKSDQQPGLPALAREGAREGELITAPVRPARKNRSSEAIEPANRRAQLYLAGDFRGQRQSDARRSADDLPVRRSCVSSEGTFLPSRCVCMPARSTALICTNTSLPPSSGWMKP